MDFRYGNLKNLASLQSAMNQSGITDSLPPKNDTSISFGRSASLLRRNLSPKMTPEGEGNKKEKEENFSSELVETGVQHVALHALGLGAFTFCLELFEKSNEAYHEMRFQKAMANEMGNKVHLGHDTAPQLSDIKSRIRVIKASIDEDEENQNKKKKKSSNSIRFGRMGNNKYTPQ